MNSVQIRGFSLSVFSCIRTEYSVNLLIQSEYKKYGPEKTPYLDTFYAVEYTDNSKPVFLFLKSFFLEKTVLGLCSSCLLWVIQQYQNVWYFLMFNSELDFLLFKNLNRPSWCFWEAPILFSSFQLFLVHFLDVVNAEYCT